MAGELTIAATLAAWVTAGALDPGRVLRSEPAPMQPGAAGELSVTILESPAPDVPLDVRLFAPDVRLAAERLGWADVVDPQARQPRLRVPFVAPAAPGRYPVRGVVTWVTCRDEQCRTHRAAVAWTVSVTGGPDPVSAAAPTAAATAASWGAASRRASRRGGARETVAP